MKKYIKPYICTTVKASILDIISTSEYISGSYDKVFDDETEYGAEENWEG